MVRVNRSLGSLALVSLLLLPLASCANSGFGQALQNSLAADPKLKEAAPEGTLNTIAGIQPAPAPAQLPSNFPTAIPRYPNATLQGVQAPETENDTTPTTTDWRTPDSRENVLSFFQKSLQTDGWQLQENSLVNPQGTLVARNNDLQVTITVPPDTTNPLSQAAGASGGTQFAIAYLNTQTASTSTPTTGTPSPSASPTTSAQPLEAFLGVEGDSESTPDTTTGTGSAPDTTTPGTGTTTATLPPNAYTDLDKAPKELQRYVADLAKLGVLNLTASNKGKSAPATTFAPNKAVSRREYARWLFAANNQLYADRAGQQLRAATSSSQPAFKDIGPNDPDFAAIQGLAEAGIIPSALSGDPTAVTFRPDAQLSRETMVLWKVPMDTRQPLPTATLEAVQQAWGFQDAAKIDPKAQRAVLADYQNGDLANIRRVFGYTTLFQPKKPVTRAEAAASLWYFGYQSEGVAAGPLATKPE